TPACGELLPLFGYSTHTRLFRRVAPGKGQPLMRASIASCDRVRDFDSPTPGQPLHIPRVVSHSRDHSQLPSFADRTAGGEFGSALKPTLPVLFLPTCRLREPLREVVHRHSAKGRQAALSVLMARVDGGPAGQWNLPGADTAHQFATRVIVDVCGRLAG